MSAPSLTQHTIAANKSAMYLKQSKSREEKRDQILALTISKGKNEFEYDCLIKMGEANEMVQALGETLTYRAYRGAVTSQLHSLISRTTILDVTCMSKTSLLESLPSRSLLENITVSNNVIIKSKILRYGMF
jgi:hypothetical protein